MKKIKKITLFIIIICFNFTANSQSLHHFHSKNNISLYQQSQKKLKDKKFNDAILLLKKIHFYDDKIKINLIYAYYKTANFNKAREIIINFKKLYPYHKNMDYILYIESLIYIKLDKNLFFPIISIGYYKTDPVYAINAFFQLKYLLFKYPHSRYVINAKKKLMCLKNRLAQHNFQILQYYYSKKEYITVINRAEEIIEKYQDTFVIHETLQLMEKSYRALNILDTAKKISTIINLNKN